MHCVFVTTSFPAHADDPAGHFVRTEARLRAARGDRVTVLVPGETESTRADDALTIVTLPGGAAFGWPGVAARLRRAPWQVAAAARWMYHARISLQKLQADEIRAHWVVPSAWPIAIRFFDAFASDRTSARAESEAHARIARSRGAARIVGVSHGADVRLLLALPAFVRTRLVTALCDSLHEWSFVSDALRASLTHSLSPSLRARVARVSVVSPPPFELPRVDATDRIEKRARIDAPHVLSIVGRLTPGKRVNLAIDYAREKGPGTHLVVVGDGPEKARLQRYAARSGVRATFIGHAPRTEAVAWIAASDELVIASAFEGLSTVAREADALGVRVRRL